MPDTRPGITIDSEGVCSACRHTEYKKTVDWYRRQKSFAKLCEKYQRSKAGQYDCVIAVSSGKDSWWQIHTVKKYGLNPLLVSVDNLDWTETGKENFNNMLDVFGVDAIVHKSNRELNRKISRLIFEKDGFIAWLFDQLIYTYPLHMAIKMNIPLIFYGENVNVEYGGKNSEETYSAINQINNDVVRDYGWKTFTDAGISMDELVMAIPPTKEQIEESRLDPRYLSYYFNWSGYEHMELAKSLGWKSLNDTGEWQRQGFIEDYDQIDDFGYLMDPWMKYPKYGHARATDVACYWIRDGRITRDEGIKLVKENDGKIDDIALEHYLDFSGYTKTEFFNIVDKFVNKDIFTKENGAWKLKDPIWNQ